MIELPRKDKEGNYYISYSQVNTWLDKKGFNTGKSGMEEYIRGYFLGEEFIDKGFGIFGKEVESYIVDRKEIKKFDDREREVLDKIIPLDIHQKEIRIQYPGFYVLGYIDDCTADYKHIRDYKTCSINSGKKYATDEYWQLYLYAIGIHQELGYYPDKIEVCCIERSGNPFKGGGRNVLAVGNSHWMIEKELTPTIITNINSIIESTANEISDYYKIFKILNNT